MGTASSLKGYCSRSSVLVVRGILEMSFSVRISDGFYARLDHLVMIHGHMVVGVLYAPFEPFQLDRFDFASLCAFDLRVPDRHGKTLLPYCLFPRRRPFLLGYLATLAERRAVVL